MSELGRLTAAGVAEWVAVAVSLLGVAWRVAHNARASAQRQGQRIGALESQLKLERTRRQQVEAVLRDLGIALPYWPPDGLQQPHSDRQRFARDVAPRDDFPDDDDQVDVDEDDPYPMTTEAARPPVPPFTADERERLARHRR